MSIPSYPLVATRPAIVATWADRCAGSASTAAMPPGGIASTIDGTTLAPAARVVAMNCAVVSGGRLPATAIVVASCAEYQNGETTRRTLPCDASDCSASGNAKYGAHASTGMSGGGGGSGSLRNARAPAAATTSTPTAAAYVRRRLLRLGSSRLSTFNSDNEPTRRRPRLAAMSTM